MGMAASQARFLQLTARKSNAEYQGQQINQARTALANKSAGLFEKMLALQAPTPPSSMDDKYYGQGYTYTDPADEVRKKITWTDFASADSSASVSIASPKYYVSNGSGGITTATVALKVSINDLADLPLSRVSGLSAPTGTVKTVLEYADISHVAYDDQGNYQTYVEKQPIVAYFDNQERMLDFQPVTISASGFDTSSYNPGSISTAATAPPTADDLIYTAAAGGSPIQRAYYETESGNAEVTKDLTYNGNFDSVAFQQDMDNYEYTKASYDYQVERINTETKQIQQEDKSLELKLKQVDTEHNAIQTEMEAVSKVITKNIESTFKTFA
jgi:hypothetical protein